MIRIVTVARATVVLLSLLFRSTTSNTGSADGGTGWGCTYSIGQYCEEEPTWLNGRKRATYIGESYDYGEWKNDTLVKFEKEFKMEYEQEGTIKTATVPSGIMALVTKSHIIGHWEFHYTLQIVDAFMRPATIDGGTAFPKGITLLEDPYRVTSYYLSRVLDYKGVANFRTLRGEAKDAFRRNQQKRKRKRQRIDSGNIEDLDEDLSDDGDNEDSESVDLGNEENAFGWVHCLAFLAFGGTLYYLVPWLRYYLAPKWVHKKCADPARKSTG